MEDDWDARCNGCGKATVAANGVQAGKSPLFRIQTYLSCSISLCSREVGDDSPGRSELLARRSY